MKKFSYIAIICFVLVAAIFSFAGCGAQKEQKNENIKSQSTQIVTEQDNKITKIDEEKYIVRVVSPDLNKPIKSPLKITGQVSGLFFNEGVFTLVLKDANGLQLGEVFVSAVGDWMTKDMVSFVGELVFKNPATSTGVLIFENLAVPTNAGITTEIPVIFDTTVVRSQTQVTPKDALNAELDKKNLARLRQSCLLGKDCIPSIDHPKFVPARKATFIKTDDVVLGVSIEKEARAYPIKILNWHEIVNDSIRRKPILITYCPLCLSGRVFERDPNGEKLEFGVSGMILNSNLVMYDRKTDTLWSQFTGEALVGAKRDAKLKHLQADMILWKDWVKKYPNTLVLSKDTGYKYDYEKYPYGDYEKNADIYFPLEYEDKRRNAKEVVYGIVVNGKQKAYPESALEKTLPKGGSLEDIFNGKKLKISFNNGFMRVLDKQTNEEILNTVSFYFSWAAFYPNTEIFRAYQ